jgi:hypothetical protein
MLEHLRQRVIQTLASVNEVTLSSSGLAGLQASRLPCEASNLDLYVLVPRTSDHLLNLEKEPDVVVVNETWSLNGTARVLPLAAYPVDLALFRSPEMRWSEVVQVHPSRFNILQPGTHSPTETIDVN